MKKWIFVVFLCLFLASSVWGADTKVTGMTAATSVAPTDLVYVVADPLNTPASRKLESARLTAITISTSTNVTVINQGYYYAHEASNGAMKYNLPIVMATPDAATKVPPGWQACFGNYNAHTSAITIQPPASHVIYYKGILGGTGASDGDLLSGGAAGDFICVVATAANEYHALGAGYGTWTLNLP